MKISKLENRNFQSKTISLTFESEEELEIFRKISRLNVSIPKLLVPEGTFDKLEKIGRIENILEQLAERLKGN